jgi:predicted helicase
MQIFQTYLQQLQKAFFSQEAIEVSYRTPLENLLNEIKTDKNITILHEGKREGKFGIPDFKIKKTESIIGYIETKIVGEDLSKILKSEQIAKYKKLTHNLLITNYLEWIWLRDGELIGRATLLDFTDFKNPQTKLEANNVQNVVTLLQQFLSTAPQGVGKVKKLAQHLAIRTKFLKDILQQELERQTAEENTGKLHGLFSTFKAFVFHELSISEFADAFAQNLAFGLFLAKLNADTAPISLYNVRQFVPPSLELIRELVDFLSELDRPEYKETKWIVEEILTLLNCLDLHAIQKELSFAEQTDPYIYFYEDFLAVYDHELRKSKGIYYTPPAVVNFIVRAIEDILKNTFGIKEGLADYKKVNILDFATGTGTFLMEIVQQILEKPANKAKKHLLIKEHILKNIYGFEYLIAPYTIAHLKLSQYLKEQGYALEAKERLHIYLTNTLEQTSQQVKIPLLPALSTEASNAQKIKDQPILVICGNPPYFGNSKNPSERVVEIGKGQNYVHHYSWNNTTKKVVKIEKTATKDMQIAQKTWIGEQLMRYFFAEGKGLDERNSKGLQNDYIKFIRFAQSKMEEVEEGIVAVITSNSFLDGLIHRGMRESLCETFNQIYILDLHGNAEKKETALDGSKDENVFSIKEGVSIAILVKKKNLAKKIGHTDYWGLRTEKYKAMAQDRLQQITWKEILPTAPHFLLVPKTENVAQEYEKFWSLKDVFQQNNVGIVTSNDAVLVGFDRQELEENVKKYYQTFEKELVETVMYRPFDKRFIYYDQKRIERARNSIMQHILQDNIGLVSARQCHNDWRYVFITNTLTDYNLTGTAGKYGSGYLFPLYLYQETIQLFSNTIDEQNPAYKKALKKLEREIKPITTFYETHQKQFEKIENPTPNEKMFFEEARALYEEHLARFEAEKSELQKSFEQKKQLKNAVEFEKIENFTKPFRAFLANYCPDYTPEKVLAYLYAILHSPTYRTKYKDLLQMDFPKIPFPNDKSVFEKLANLGQDLIEVHLQNTLPTHEGAVWAGKQQNYQVEKIQYVSEKQRLYINADQYFEKVLPEVFEFQVGGYQVLEKYLKERKDRILSLLEIQTFENITKCLAYTIVKMEEIDENTEIWV